MSTEIKDLFKEYDVSGDREMLYELSDHDLGDLIKDIEALIESKLKEQREICQKELCNIFGHTAQNYEQTINDGTINAPSPKI